MYKTRLVLASTISAFLDEPIYVEKAPSAKPILIACAGRLKIKNINALLIE